MSMIEMLSIVALFSEDQSLCFDAYKLYSAKET